MKKMMLLVLTIALLTALTGCKKEEKEIKITEHSTVSMKRVDNTEQSTNKADDSKKVTGSAKTTPKKVNIKELLNDFGDGYANYDSINDRNNKLKKVMTDECIKMNGINFESAVMLSSRGEVTSIYQPIDGEKNQYSILLNCEQNGSKVRVLLLVKVTGDKVSEMTYNTVKQEY